MQLCDQVCTLKQAFELQALGFKPKTHAFWWVYNQYLPHVASAPPLLPDVIATNSWQWCRFTYRSYSLVPAFTASELAVLLWPQLPHNYSFTFRMSEAHLRAHQLITIIKSDPDTYSVPARLGNLENIRYVSESSCIEVSLPADADRDADHFTSFPDFDGE